MGEGEYTITFTATLKEDTELQILRSLSNTPLQVDVVFVTVSSHESKNTSKREAMLAIIEMIEEPFKFEPVKNDNKTNVTKLINNIHLLP